MLIGAYSALLSLGLIASAPWWLLRMATTQRYREGLRERLGEVPRALRDAVAGRQVVWVHAVSVGEVLAISQLVKDLETSLNETASQTSQTAWRVVISSTTRTGQALARERFGAERVFYFPLDFAWAVRAYLGALRPSLLILAESELWPRMLHECQRTGVPVAVVNGRVSDRSFRRSFRVRRVWARMARKVTLWLAQSDEDARRLVALGATGSAVRASGNLKYDVRPAAASRIASLIREAASGRPIVVAGSTVNSEAVDEDRLLIQAWERAPRRELNALLVLAPRHPERFGDVISASSEFPTLTATELLAQGSRAPAWSAFAAPDAAPGIIVLNTIGDLASVYGIADVAFVGGSLAPKGGHNPLEPARFGVPVIMGPSCENFRDIVENMRAADGIRIVHDEHELAATLTNLLRRPEDARALGELGRKVFQREGGATARSIEALMRLLNVSEARAAEAVSA